MGIRIFGAVKSQFKDSGWGGYFLFISIFALFFFANHQYVSQNLNLPQWIVVEIKTDSPIQLEVYYDAGDGYGEKDRRVQFISGNESFQRIRIGLPRRPLRSFRIDPLTEPGVVYIKSITLESLWGRNHFWSADQIVKDFRPQNDISQFEIQNDAIKIRSTGIDPYFGLISSPPRINQISDSKIILTLFVFSLLCVLFYKMLLVIKEHREKTGRGNYLRAFRVSLILIGVSLPILLAIHFIRRNSINVPFRDQWELVPLLSALFEGKPWVHLLSNFHNEHRMIFPRFMFLLLAVFTRWDVVLENHVNLFFVGLMLIVIWRLLKETGGPPVLMVPVSWLLFSLQQWENLLSGWQEAFLMMLSAAILSIFCLNRVHRNGYYTFLALISGALASFSSMSGLCIWPAGLLQLLMMRAKKSVLFAWFMGGVLTIRSYFLGYHKPANTPDVLMFLKSPVDFIKYILAYLGSSVSGDSLRQSIVYGALFVLLFLSAIAFHGSRMKRWENMVPWVTVGVFSLLCGGMIGIGRLGYGIDQAMSSRYISISSLFFLSAMILSVFAVVVLNPRGKNMMVVVLLVITMIVCSGFMSSYLSGIREGYYRKLFIGQFSRSLYHLEKTDDSELRMIYPDVEVLKDRAAILQNLRIGPYAPTAQSMRDASN